MKKGESKETSWEEKLTDFEKGMLVFMRVRYPDKNKMGVELTGDEKKPEYNRLAAEEWFRYFKHHDQMKKARFLASQMGQQGSFMVPTLWPDEYDPTWKRRGTSWVDRSQPKER